jgi:hypothetical protein
MAIKKKGGNDLWYKCKDNNNYSEIHDLEIKLNFMLNLNRQLSS